MPREREGAFTSDALRALLAALAHDGGAVHWYDASIITALPGRGRQPAHRDYAPPANAGGDWKLVVFTPVDDVARAGGATVVCPGTHFGTAATGRGKHVRLANGDALVFFSSLLHYGAANKAARERVLYSQTFSVRGPRLRAAADAAPSCDKEVARGSVHVQRGAPLLSRLDGRRHVN